LKIGMPYDNENGTANIWTDDGKSLKNAKKK
jgi:hypothetical protein